MKQQTFIMIKPDAVERGLVESILDIFKEAGYHIERSKEVLVDEKLILKHYEDVIKALNIDYFQGAILDLFLGKKVFAYVISKEGEHVIEDVRKLIGATDPAKADPKSIRGRFGIDAMSKSMAEKRMLRNLIHASDSLENAQKEIELWFGH